MQSISRTCDAAPLCWMCGVRPVAAAGQPLCADCTVSVAPYDDAWRDLAAYFRAHWTQIARRGSFDLSQAFAKEVTARSLDVHMFFVKSLGSRLSAQNVSVNLASFTAALRARMAHPEIVALVANCHVAPGKFLSYDSEVSVLRHGDEVYSALWTYLEFPVAIKICYLKTGAPVRAPNGFPWHPDRQRKIVKVSPYKGDAQPLVARRDLRI